MKGDELNYLKSITSEGNSISWSNQAEADLIHPGDIIQVNGKNEILKNGEKIGNVVGFKENKKK